jgi:hypothetical protein
LLIAEYVPVSFDPADEREMVEVEWVNEMMENSVKSAKQIKLRVRRDA